MKILSHYPFPQRKDKLEKHVFYFKSDSMDYLSYCYEKNTSAEAVLIANQFFSIEDIFQESFQYVTPIYKNKNTSSARFGTIIRESCNLYEILCRKVYNELFDYDLNCSLNIYNYLTLEYFFKINQEEIRTAIFHNYLENNSRIKPFNSMSYWKGDLKLKQENVPDWWTAYNKIKHDTNSNIDYATLNNAIYSFAALFLVIRKIYGEGLISGFLRKPTTEINISAHMYPIRNSNIFIGEIYKSAKR